MSFENTILLDTCDSTNDYAKSLARETCADKTIIRTKIQTHGRGRQGNTWESFDSNLYMSMVLYPDVAMEKFGQMSFVTAVALARTLDEAGMKNISLKWPNDVLLNGEKVAGILLETETFGDTQNLWLVVGVGVNIEGSPKGATNLKQSGYEKGVDDFFPLFTKNLIKTYDEWQEMGFKNIQKEWMARAAYLNEDICVRLPKETFTAKLLDIDETGALRVEKQDQTIQIISSGEVFGL